MPDTAPTVMPHTHRIVAEDDALLPNVNLGQLLPGEKDPRQSARDSVMVAFDDVNVPASDSISVMPHAVRAAQTEITEEVENVVLFHRGVQSIENDSIHLPGRLERTAAIADDVLVSEVKVSAEPSGAHGVLP
jgi:hypothetical protein